MTLEQGHKNGKQAHFRNRCLSILLRNRGKSVPYISDLLGIRPEAIYEWSRRWDSMGIVGLMILPGRGLKAKLDILLESPTQESLDLVESVKKKINTVGMKFTFSNIYPRTLCLF